MDLPSDLQAPRPGVARALPRKPRRPLGWLPRIAGTILGGSVLLGLVALVVAFGAYRHFAADLPDVEGLRSYQPRIMSRVYAGDDRPIAELATERRVFIPYASIPELVRQAFV